MSKVRKEVKATALGQIDFLGTKRWISALRNGPFAQPSGRYNSHMVYLIFFCRIGVRGKKILQSYGRISTRFRIVDASGALNDGVRTSSHFIVKISQV